MCSQTAGRSEAAAQRTHLELSDVERLSVEQLKALCASLRQDIQGESASECPATAPQRFQLHWVSSVTIDLSSELVSRLHIRDQLRTEQDAMLLEVQDLTAL